MRFTLCFDGATAGKTAWQTAQQAPNERIHALGERSDALAEILRTQGATHG